jgi:hypothetical protein
MQKQVKHFFVGMICSLLFSSYLVASLVHEQSCEKKDIASQENTAEKHQADLVAFSFDRPLQLEAFLRSVTKLVTGISSMYVIYRTSNDEFEQAYHQLIAQYPEVIFEKQGNEEGRRFKELLLKCSFESPSDHLMYGVDDIIVTDTVDLSECIKLLEQEKRMDFICVSASILLSVTRYVLNVAHRKQKKFVQVFILGSLLKEKVIGVCRQQRI